MALLVYIFLCIWGTIVALLIDYNERPIWITFMPSNTHTIINFALQVFATESNTVNGHILK